MAGLMPRPLYSRKETVVDCFWNVMAHAQKPDFVFRRNGRVHLNRRGRQLSRLLTAEVCASPVLMLDTPCSEVVWRVLSTHSIRHFAHSLPLPCVNACHHISAGLAKWLPTFQVATKCFSRSSSRIKSQFISNQLHVLFTCEITTATGLQPNFS